MGGMPWFRMYSEFAADPKVQSMDETSQRRLVMLLCLMCDGCLSSLSDEEVACALRISVEEAISSKELFIKKGFLGENWSIKNWDKRQYKSDKSAERTRAWRERNKSNKDSDGSVTSLKRNGDVAVTPPDTDTDKKNKIPYVEIIANLNNTAGTKFKPSTKATRQHISARWNEGFSLDDFILVINKKTADWRGDLKFEKYLRPETLFGTKFESYLNEPEKKQSSTPEWL